MRFKFKIYFPENDQQFLEIELDRPDYADTGDKPEDIVRWLWEDMTDYLTYTCEVIVDRISK